jgi:hypothetical protein
VDTNQGVEEKQGELLIVALQFVHKGQNPDISLSFLIYKVGIMMIMMK